MEQVRICVGPLTKYLKQIQNQILFKIKKHRDYFIIYKNCDVNEFFWCMCILGGGLRSKKVGKKLKIFWLIYYTFSACSLIIYNTYAFLRTKENSLTTILMLLRAISLESFSTGSYIISVLFHKSIEKYIEELDQYLSTSLQQEHDQYVYNMKFADMLVLSLYSVVFCHLGIPILFPFALDLEANSRAFYLILSMAKLHYALLCVIIPIYCGLRMRTIFVKKFLHTTNELKNQIKCFSIATLQNLESTYHREIIVESDASILEEGEYNLNLLTRRRNAIYANVDENIVYFAKQHKKLFTIHTNIKTYFETICSVVISCAFSIQVVVGIDIVQVIEGRTQVDIWSTTLLILYLCALTYVVNANCAVITVVEDEMQVFCDEIYSIPWYLLPTKTRKMIALLLTQWQNTRKFRLFGMYPFGAPLVPQFLNSVYSYISVLRVMMLKKSK